MGKNMKSYTTAALAIMLCGLMAGKASAALVTESYADTWLNFPGWEVDTRDQIGNPQVSSMSVTYDGESRLLDSVTIYLQNRIVWDTLFINADWTQGEAYDTWNYMARDQTGGRNSHITGYIPAGGDGLGGHVGFFSVDEGYDYTLATEVGTRIGHPNGIVPDDLSRLYFGNKDTQKFIIWDEIAGTLTYNFTYLYGQSVENIILGDRYMLAYTQHCANDLIGTAVPEPGTLLLFGAGLAGLIGIGRRRVRIEQP